MLRSELDKRFDGEFRKEGAIVQRKQSMRASGDKGRRWPLSSQVSTHIASSHNDANRRAETPSAEGLL